MVLGSGRGCCRLYVHAYSGTSCNLESSEVPYVEKAWQSVCIL